MSGSKFPLLIGQDDDGNWLSMTDGERHSALEFHYGYILTLLAVMIGIVISNKPIDPVTTALCIGSWVILALVFRIDLRKSKPKSQS